jgi:hypothetical protein
MGINAHLPTGAGFCNHPQYEMDDDKLLLGPNTELLLSTMPQATGDKWMHYQKSSRLPLILY